MDIKLLNHIKEEVFKPMSKEEAGKSRSDKWLGPLWAFQTAGADETERPGTPGSNPNSIAWVTMFESDDLEVLLSEICEMLNDEEYPSNEWVRITKNGFPVLERKHGLS